MVEFKSYRVRLEPKRISKTAPPLDGVPTRDLLAAPGRYYAAELHWRLAKPVSVIVLALFAIVLAYTDPRRGRMSNLLAAILVYFIYANVLGIGETLIKEGTVPGRLGLWWVHAVLAAVGGYLLWRRANNRRLLAWPGLMG